MSYYLFEFFEFRNVRFKLRFFFAIKDQIINVIKCMASPTLPKGRAWMAWFWLLRHKKDPLLVKVGVNANNNTI